MSGSGTAGDLNTDRLPVHGVELCIQGFLGNLELGLGIRQPIEQGGILIEGLALVGEVRVLADLLEARLHGLGCNLLLLTLALNDLNQEALLPALFFPLLVELLLNGTKVGFDGGDSIPVGSEVAFNENAPPERGQT